MGANSENYFLGVDGGATQSKAAIVGERGQVLSEGEGRGVNYRVVGFEGLAENLKETILGAQKKANINFPLAFAVFGLAGCDSASNQKNLQELIAKNFSQYFSGFLVFNDTRIALRSGTREAFGIAVVAGTGSNIYGRNRTGEEAAAAGLDYLLADEGSAYDIGLRVLRAAVRSFDGREEKSLLEEMVMRELGIQNMRAAVDKVYQPLFNKAKIASFAPLAEEAASSGDHKAGEILLLAAHELFLGVKAVVKRLRMEKEGFDLVMVGSVFQNKIVLGQFQKEVGEFVAGVRFTFPQIPPAQAAALLAKEEYAKMR